MNQNLLRQSLEEVAQNETPLTKRFYEILFQRYPAVRSLFGRRSEEAQAKMLQESIVAVVEHLDNERWLAANLRALGRTHRVYGVTAEMYSWVGECLLAALADLLGDRWSPELESAWSTMYGRICDMMMEGAMEEEAVAAG